ncbi:hypothetical protein L1049_018407 [Liquidambar formosana]|uniref:RING-type domain-containing protein n=1 Tax=Liquidambar formosana TaxID=63359 RepID=A0AAP0RA18_LIQFO
MSSLSLSPPPFYNVLGGSAANNDNAYVQSSSASSSSHSSMQNLNPSIITVILVISVTVIVSTALCLLIRYLNRFCRRSSSSIGTDNVSGGVSLQRENRFSSRRVLPEDQSVIDSLPVFTFNSVIGRSGSSGDCAVCLSKFEPHDQLRLLPICCHAFHVQCIDTWLQSNQTCPLCRSPIHASESDILNKVMATSAARDSFRIEIGNVSRRQALSDSGEARRSYSVGSFDYVVDDESEVSVMNTHVRGVSDHIRVDKDENETPASEPVRAPAPVREPPGPSIASEVSSGRSWLREYVDRLSVSVSSGARSFRSSGRFFTGSSRRSELPGTVEWDVEANRVGEEISELFRWFSGV